jgi:hypothetical protein
MHTMTSIALALTMLQPSASVLSPAQNATPTAPQPQSQILDSRWIPDIGNVQLSSPGGPRLEVIVRELGGTEAIKQPMLDPLPADARIIEASASRYFGDQGLAIAVVVEHRGTVTYHFLSTPRLLPVSTPRAPDEPVWRGWVFTDPIFTSTDEPYRIVDVHGGASDAIEITFRRGFKWSKGVLDEKIYVHVCPGLRDPFVAGGTLYDVLGVQPVLDTRVRPR